VADLPHHARPPAFVDLVVERLRALDLADEGRARLLAEDARANRIISWSPQMMRPLASTTPMRSASPSKAMPTSAPVSATVLTSSATFSAGRIGVVVGSGRLARCSSSLDLEAERAVERPGGDAAHAVAGVDDDARPARAQLEARARVRRGRAGTTSALGDCRCRRSSPASR
jgi:hypothetical protein